MNLVDMGKMKGADKIVKVCANVKAGERVLVVTDTQTLRVGELVAMASLQVSENTVLAVMTPRSGHGAEPPLHMAAAMGEADVIFMPLKFSMSHALATAEARKRGARVLSMGDYNERMLEEGGIHADFIKIAKIVERVAERLTHGRIADVSAIGGTKLRMDITGRKGFSETGLCHRRGEFGGPPNIEANVGPLEGSTEGILVVDGSIPQPGLGVITDPIRIKIIGGRITEIEGGKQAKVLRQVLSQFDDPWIYNIAELGIGLNPQSTITGSMMEDEGAYGTCHIGIGSNIDFEGKVKAKSHIDMIIRESTILIDGNPIQEHGELIKEMTGE
jgi:2,5-dihydroxypyridine 5,6-dioxygenase